MAPAVVGGPGSAGTEALASMVADKVTQDGWVATLDDSLALDYVTPAAVTRGMEKLGLPRGFAQVLHAQWTDQRRLLQWNTSTYASPLCTSMAVQQGDPMSPCAQHTNDGGTPLRHQQMPGHLTRKNPCDIHGRQNVEQHLGSASHSHAGHLARV